MGHYQRDIVMRNAIIGSFKANTFHLLLLAYFSEYTRTSPKHKFRTLTQLKE